MPFIMRNETFTCIVCNKNVDKHPSGSARNHCPECLTSLHVDKEFPGDRASSCQGIMSPIGFGENKKGYCVIQKCQKCGKENRNIVAPDDKFIAFMRRKNSEIYFRQ